MTERRVEHLIVEWAAHGTRSARAQRWELSSSSCVYSLQIFRPVWEAQKMVSFCWSLIISGVNWSSRINLEKGLEWMFLVVCLTSVSHLPFAAAALRSLMSEWQHTPPSWGTTDDPCETPSWDGVSCNDSRVTVLWASFSETETSFLFLFPQVSTWF